MGRFLFPYEDTMSLVSLWILVTIVSCTLQTKGVEAELFLQPSGRNRAFFTHGKFFISCNSKSGSLTDGSLVWKGPNGQPITSTSGRMYVEKGQLMDHSLALVVNSVLPEDEGTYTCTTENGQHSISFELVVYKPVEFTNTPLVQNTSEGRDYTLRCNYEVDPRHVTLQVAWLIKGQPLPNNDSKFVETQEGLLVKNATREDEGNYTCKVSVVTPLSSQIKQIAIQLSVHHGPEWGSDFKDKVYAVPGSTANLSCEAIGSPPPSYEWLRAGRVLQNDSSFVVLKESRRKILQVKLEDKSLFGQYTCTAEGARGKIEKSVELIELAPPGPSSLTVEKNEDGTLHLKLDSSDGNSHAILGYRIEYKLASSSWNESKYEKYCEESSCVLQDLTLDTAYVIRASARNAAGYGALSKELSVTTKNAAVNGGVPHVPPAHLAQLLVPFLVSWWILTLLVG